MDRNAEARARLLAVYEELLRHEGYGSLRVEMRILKRGQKEVIVDCGKQYRFVLDYPGRPEPAAHPRGVPGSASRSAETRDSLPGDAVSRDTRSESLL